MNKLIVSIKTQKWITKIAKYFNQPPTKLGRWSRDIRDDQMIRRIERANEDHCGPCGYENVKHTDLYSVKSRN